MAPELHLEFGSSYIECVSWALLTLCPLSPFYPLHHQDLGQAISLHLSLLTVLWGLTP